MKKTYTIIGPRIADLGGFDKAAQGKQDAIKKVINQVVIENQKAGWTLLSGCALGIEMWALQSALANKADYHLYVPFDNFEQKWPSTSQKIYQKIVEKANKVIQTGTGEFSIDKLKAKDHQMWNDAETVYHFYLILPKYIKLDGKTVVPKMEDVESDEFIAF